MERFAKDLEITQQTLIQLAATTSSTERKAYYEWLHLSPMVINVSFSQGVGDGGGKAVPIHSEFLKVLLKSVGVTLTEFQDARLK